MNSLKHCFRITQYIPRSAAGVLRQYGYPAKVRIDLNFRQKSTTSVEEEIDPDSPIKFSSSRAATWKARDTYGGGKDKKGIWITSTQHQIFQPRQERNCKRLYGPAFSHCKILNQSKPVSVQQHRTFMSDWDQKRHKEVPRYQTFVVTLSVASFLGYFLWFREPSDIDENMSRPIWERLPGIDPERAEVMMELDRHLGLQVDYEALQKYKEDYYAKQAEELEIDRMRIEARQKEVKLGSGNHSATLHTYANRRDSF